MHTNKCHPCPPAGPGNSYSASDLHSLKSRYCLGNFAVGHWCKMVQKSAAGRHISVARKLASPMFLQQKANGITLWILSFCRKKALHFQAPLCLVVSLSHLLATAFLKTLML